MLWLFVLVMVFAFVICPIYLAWQWFTSIWSVVLFLIFAAIFFFSWLAFFTCLFGLITDSDSDYDLDLVLLTADAAVCIIGFLISLFVICTFVDKDYGSKTLGWILLGTVILGILLCIVAIMGVAGRILSLLGAAAYIVILSMWTIGFHLSYDIKCSYSNVAWYECTEIKKESYYSDGSIKFKQLNGYVYDTTGKNARKISEDHIIDTYDVGDVLFPSGEGVKTYEGNAWEIISNKLWYGVYTSDGESGWIPSTGIDVYYCSESEYETEKREEKVSGSWYCRMPQSWLNACESLFESQEHSYQYNLAD